MLRSLSLALVCGCPQLAVFQMPGNNVIAILKGKLHNSELLSMEEHLERGSPLPVIV
jgi:hypothetical protein